MGAYKKAADNIKVDKDEDGKVVSIETNSKDGRKAAAEKQRLQMKNKLYSQFIQSATLTDGIMTDSKPNSQNASSDSESEEEEDDSNKKHKRLTDEELFK